LRLDLKTKRSLADAHGQMLVVVLQFPEFASLSRAYRERRRSGDSDASVVVSPSSFHTDSSDACVLAFHYAHIVQ